MKTAAKKPHVKKAANVRVYRPQGSFRHTTKISGGGKNVNIVYMIVGRKLPSTEIIRYVQDGLEMCEVEDLRSALDVPMEKLAPKLGISKATLHRRKAAGRLDSAE